MMLDRIGFRAERGFTLVELLIVIAIIGILTAVAIPQFNAFRKRSYTAQVTTDLRNAATAQEAYLVDTNDYSSTLSGLTSRGYVQQADVTLGVVGTSAGGFRLTAGHSNCTSGQWSFDSGQAGSSFSGGPCG